MTNTLEQDRYTIERKYHIPEEAFDPFCHNQYHGYDYDSATGWDDEQIARGLEALAQECQDLPHPVCKARLFSYVLDHTRIDINEHDYFIGIYSWNRPISRHTAGKWYQEVLDQASEAHQVWQSLSAAGIAIGGLDFDHTVPDWDALMSLGFPGLLHRAEACFQKLQDTQGVTQKQADFFQGVQIEYRAILRFLDRLWGYALTKKSDKANRIAECLMHLRNGAPTNTYEALQLIYIYFMLSENLDHYQVRSLGYGLDSTLYPFYQKDILSGRFSREEIGQFIGYFLLQWSAMGNYWGQPLYLGGMHPNQTTKVNSLSWLILDVYHKLGIYNPKIQIKVSPSTPKEFVCKALDIIRQGNSSIVFCNEDVITKCLMSRGYSYEDSVDSVISGCYEYKTKGKDIGISCTYLNALKPVSLVLDNGFDHVSGKNIGIPTGTSQELVSFDDFYQAYLKQLEYCATNYVDAINVLEANIQHINPCLMYSGTNIHCMNTMTDALDAGIENTTDILISGLGTAVDALMAVKEWVYDKKRVTLDQLQKALLNDWEGEETLRLLALNSPLKYGNNNPEADHYAAHITEFIGALFSDRKNSHGGGYNLEMHSARAFIVHGQRTIATPDGRKFGDETSKNASPTPGADKRGITALIHSATRIDSTLCNNGFCLDAMLHPSAVQGEEGLEVMYAVLSTYHRKGGASMHFNIMDETTLKDAQLHPEKYQNLQVRVCGWNVLWNHLDKAEQDAYILRAKHLNTAL